MALAKVIVHLSAALAKKVRADARAAKKSLSAYIAERLEYDRNEDGWPKGYVEMVRGWKNDPLDLENPPDEPITLNEFASKRGDTSRAKCPHDTLALDSARLRSAARAERDDAQAKMMRGP